MASFITAFLLMRSSTAMNSSGLSTLPCLDPILTSNSSEAPSPTTTLAVVFSYVCSQPSSFPLLVLPSTVASPSPSIWVLYQNLSPGRRTPEPYCPALSLLCHLSQDVHPVCCSSLLPEPLLFFPEVTLYSYLDHCV